MSIEGWLLRQTTRPTLVRCVERLARRGALSQGPSQPRQIALTFDDGPDPAWTPSVLAELDAIGARATFFVVGSAAARYPELVRETRRRGHEIGTHLYSHERGVVFDSARFYDELSRCQRELSEILGEPLRWLRFPYGEAGAQSPREVRERFGVHAVHWTFSSHDSRAPDAAAICRRVGAALRPGAIVLMHDATADADRIRPPYVAERTATIQSLQPLGRLLASQGLFAVTLSELFSGAL